MSEYVHSIIQVLLISPEFDRYAKANVPSLASLSATEYASLKLHLMAKLMLMYDLLTDDSDSLFR